MKCQACKDYSQNIKVLNKRAATKRARACREAAHNLNLVINSDLRAEDSELKRVLDDLNAEKAKMEAKINNKLIEYELLVRSIPTPYKTPPEMPTSIIEVPEATPKPPLQEWENRKIKVNSQ